MSDLSKHFPLHIRFGEGKILLRVASSENGEKGIAVFKSEIPRSLGKIGGGFVEDAKPVAIISSVSIHDLLILQEHIGKLILELSKEKNNDY